MARTKITAHALALGAQTADPAHDDIDQANGMVLEDCDPARVIFRVVVTNVAGGDVTIKAGANPPASVAADNKATYVQNAVKWVPAAPGARHAQANGDIYVDFSANVTGEITAFVLPLGM